MILKLLPYFVAFAAGFGVCLTLLARSRAPGASRDWETKYHDLLERFRSLSQRLKEVDQGTDVRTSRLRRTLNEVRTLLANGKPPNHAAERALKEIDAALKES